MLQLIQLAVSIILARLLTPVDFGLIALVAVFIAVADTIALGGFRGTIIMRPHLGDIDFSTAFVYNLAVAVLLYLAMFFSAPLIARFYAEPQLVVVLRVLGLVNILHAGYFVQDALLQKNMQFKLLAKRNIAAAIISGCLAITMAFLGWGVWALVGLTVTRAIVINIYLWMNSVWKLSLRFSWESFKKNFSFGSRIMVTNITGVLFTNLNNLLIGKFYTKADLGFYYQARKLKNVPIDSAMGILTKTSVPLLSKYQEDFNELHRTYTHITRIAAISIVPLVSLLFVVSSDLIVVLFTAKWQPSVPIFRIIILAGLFAPFVIINGHSSAIMGDSKFYLRIDTAFKGLILLVTFIALRFGLYVFIASQTALILVQMIMNAFIARKFFKIGLRAQAGVYAPYFVFSLVAGLCAWLIGMIPEIRPVISLILRCVVFISAFSGLVFFFERSTFEQVRRMLTTAIGRLKLR